ncbi:hypothetical protein BHE74_00054735 [Ensete ventricosum]|nr:hypothetical protein BHE74_00054735 [Ensete ventricosum]RZS26456.1 hypothetical protein BHM03_00059800 [Ensete ventricosum]
MFAGPAINIQFGNLKPFPKPAENGNANSEHLIAGVGSENLLNILNKPTGCHQSICSSILQNVRSSEISRNFSLAMPAFHTMGSSTHQGIVSTAAMQQKQHLSPQRCMVPLGDVMPQEQRHYLVPQGVELDSASKTHVNSQVSGSDEAPAEPEQKFQDHNTGDENRINLRRTESASLYESNNAQQSEMVYVALPTDSNKQSDDMIKTISHDILAENLDQLPKHQNVESFTSPFDHDDIADQISVKQGLQVKIQGHRKIVRQQSDPPGAQSPGLDATQSIATYVEQVQKLGSVGRSIDVTRFSNYHELISAVACMFGLEGQLDDDPRGSEWKLVYVDYESDVLLVGMIHGSEEFINCVRCIRILSASEVQQMSQEGIQVMEGFV